MAQQITAAPKLLLDEHIWPDLCVILVLEGFDLIYVNSTPVAGQSDELVLNYATSVNRAVLTYNTRDFIVLDKEWKSAGKSHSGIIVSDQLVRGELLRRVRNLLTQLPAFQLLNNIIYLQNYK